MRSADHPSGPGDAGELSRRQVFGYVEVGQERPAIRIAHKDVAWLDVAVNNPFCMRGIQPGCNVAKYGRVLFGRKHTHSAQNPGERFALNQLHRKKERAVTFA